MDDIVISVIVYAYNHEKYISDCLESIVQQQTDFKYEIIVHDDASTDNTATIIRWYVDKYPDLIIPIFELKNTFNGNDSLFSYVSPYIKGEYMQVIEGDDCFCDSEKLQKQVDYLRTNPQCVACFHNVERLDCQTGQVRLLYKYGNSILPGYEGFVEEIPENGFFTYEELVDKIPYIQLSSFLAVTEVYKKLKDLLKRNYTYLGDWFIILYVAMYGKIGYINEAMSVYRRQSSDFAMSTRAKQLPQEVLIKEMSKTYQELFSRMDELLEMKYHDWISDALDYKLFVVCDMHLKRGFLKNRYLAEWFKSQKTKHKLYILFRAFFPHMYELLKNWND